jgi:hypothetical protein
VAHSRQASLLNRLAEQNYITVASDGYVYLRAGN